MELLSLVAVIGGIAFLAVWRPCLRAVRRSRRPSPWVSLVGGLAAALTMVGVFEGHGFITGEVGIRDGWLLRVIVLFTNSFLVGSAVSLMIVVAYRRRKMA